MEDSGFQERSVFCLVEKQGRSEENAGKGRRAGSGREILLERMCV